MVKRLVPIVAALVLMTSAQLYALSLGELTLESASGQPLNARIILLDTVGFEPGDISVQLASQADFDRFDLERNPALENLIFDVELGGSAGPVLRLRSPVTISEPFVSLVLDVRWPAGRVLTEYTIRLEAPAFSAQSSAPASVSPARSVFEAVETPAVVSAATVSAAAPETQSAAASTTAATASGAGQPAAAPVSSSLANASTITVNAGDTLWEIALRVRPDSSVSVQQTMLALQRLNPGAFINNNINQVRRGEVLRVPELNEIRQMSASEAVAEVTRQNQAQAQRPATSTPAQPITPAPGSAPQGTAAQGELRVVTVDDTSDQRPDASAAGDQAAQTRQRLQDIENRLALRQEDLDRQDAQNEELNARLAMLQQQIASAQEIIRLRDLELAQLQQSLAEQTPVATTPPPTVITMAPDAGPVERFVNAVISNTWALLGGALALILALVLILVRRNKAAREQEQADQRGNDDMPLGEDSDELLFSGVAAAAAEAAVDDSDDDERPISAEAAETYAAIDQIVDDEDPNEDFDINADQDAIGQDDESLADEEVARPDARYDIADPDPDTLEPDWGETELDEDFEPQHLGSIGGQNLTETKEAEGADTDSDDFAWVEEDSEVSETESETAQTADPEELQVADARYDISDVDDLPVPDEPAQPVTTPDVEPAGEAVGDDEVDDFDDLAFISTDESLQDEIDDEDDEDFAFLSDSDEAATKLDLARAYIDMGDVDGAREILNEVLQEGTETQRRDAEVLLDRL